MEWGEGAGIKSINPTAFGLTRWLVKLDPLKRAVGGKIRALVCGDSMATLKVYVSNLFISFYNKMY